MAGAMANNGVIAKAGWGFNTVSVKYEQIKAQYGKGSRWYE